MHLRMTKLLQCLHRRHKTEYYSDYRNTFLLVIGQLFIKRRLKIVPNF